MQKLKTDTTTLHERICAAIKEHIVERRLQPGDRLPSEHELADMLGVSRASVREALTSLNALGVIDIRVGRGAFVQNFNFNSIAEHLSYGLHFLQEDLNELVDIRRLLEVHTVEQVTPQIKEEHLAQLRAVVAQMEAKAAQGQDFIEEDIAFHRLISEAYKRRVLGAILNGFWQLQSKIRRIDTNPESLRKRCQEHRAILEALEQRDKRSAVYYMEKHFDRLQERLAQRERKDAAAIGEGSYAHDS